MTVNSASWKRFPVAHREQPFNADDAIARIGEWARGDASRYASAFLWRNPQGQPNNRNSYRLPVADVIDGKLTLIPRAVFAAAAILSGAHGGLVGVVGDEEKKQLKGVVTDIYAMLQETYQDPRVKPPWLRGGNEEEDVTASLVASVNSSGWSSMPIADSDTEWSGSAARAALWNWADGDFRKYRRGFLWWDQGEPDQRGSYKLPIATVRDGRLVIVPRAVNAVAAVLGGARGGVDIPDRDMDAVEAVVKRIQERINGGESSAEGGSETAAADTVGGPVRPPREWFDDPELNAPTPITVTADGRVMGHLAAWGVCHMRYTDRCVPTPRSAINYKLFHNGTVLTASGETIPVGKITLGTGHADRYLGWIPAADHYDNTGTAVAVVAAGEDGHGVWVAGSILPGVPEEKVAELRRSPLSGDWRRFQGNLELVAALAVNVPGYPILNLSASGEPETLMAAGVVDIDGTVYADPLDGPLSDGDKDALERLGKLTSQAQELLADRRMRRWRNLTGGR